MTRGIFILEKELEYQEESQKTLLPEDTLCTKFYAKQSQNSSAKYSHMQENNQESFLFMIIFLGRAEKHVQTRTVQWYLKTFIKEVVLAASLLFLAVASGSKHCPKNLMLIF